jgi:ligand-binding SRPBCC domain-containing protein
MPVIELNTNIKSSIETVFDLSTSIDLHKLSTSHTNEEAIDGTTKGLIKLNEFVTWEATHFGLRQKLTSKITEYQRPYHFRDEQLSGPFKLIKHDHFFEQKDEEVIMKDIFEYESPFGWCGQLFNKLILTNYLRKFLISRNYLIKEFAESEKWKAILENINSKK